MEPIENASGGFKELPSSSNGVAKQHVSDSVPNTDMNICCVHGPVPKSDLARRVPNLLSFLLARPIESSCILYNKPPEQTSSSVEIGNAEETGVQQLIHEFQNLNTGGRMRTIRKTIRRDRKIISTRPHNYYSFNFLPSIENNGMQRRTVTIHNRDRRISSRFHRMHSAFTTFARGDFGHKVILDIEEHANLANNNLIYVPSLMDIPEYPENDTTTCRAKQEETDTAME